MKQLQQKAREENQALMKENAKVLDRRMAEQKKLLEEGFQEKAQAMRDEVQQIQRQQEEYRRAMENANQGGGFLDFLSSAFQTGALIYGTTLNPVAAVGGGLLGGLVGSQAK